MPCTPPHAMHHPCTNAMHGPACPLTLTQIRPHLTAGHSDYMILLLTKRSYNTCVPEIKITFLYWRILTAKVKKLFFGHHKIIFTLYHILKITFFTMGSRGWRVGFRGWFLLTCMTSIQRIKPI